MIWMASMFLALVGIVIAGGGVLLALRMWEVARERIGHRRKGEAAFFVMMSAWALLMGFALSMGLFHIALKIVPAVAHG